MQAALDESLGLLSTGDTGRRWLQQLGQPEPRKLVVAQNPDSEAVQTDEQSISGLSQRSLPSNPELLPFLKGLDPALCSDIWVTVWSLTVRRGVAARV